MTLPTSDGLHYVGCVCNEPCTCDEIECVHEQCICNRLRAAYRRGREDAANAVREQCREIPLTTASHVSFMYLTAIAAARGDGDCQHDWQHLKGEKCATCRRCGAARGDGGQA